MVLRYDQLDGLKRDDFFFNKLAPALKLQQKVFSVEVYPVKGARSPIIKIKVQNLSGQELLWCDISFAIVSNKK